MPQSPPTGFDPDRFITDRLRAIDASGIRRVFDLAAQLENPINLSIGQPDFDVPQPIKDAACDAIQAGRNSYTQTQGIQALREKAVAGLQEEQPATYGRPGEPLPDDLGVLITSGVSGALVLALLTSVGPGDEVLIADPAFVMYRHLVTLAGATPVFVDTYPDFQLTAERVEPLITERTKVLLFNTPANPTGVVASPETCRQIAELAAEHKLLLLSDEIYDEFCYEKVAPEAGGKPRLASPAATNRQVMVMRGFSKTWAMTGWRLGYVVGPKAIIEQMTKLQQYSFVCAPSMVQVAGTAALDVDMSDYVEAYRRKRDRVAEVLGPHYELTTPGGAFYAFPKVPEKLGLTATEFVEKAVRQGLLIIPGSVFSERDTHFRLSYACDDETLETGLAMLVDLAQG
ncbi:MAG: pyridoxal phosphate-dependent aminotransferase [Phycisphaeraceae bacterium]